MSFLITSKQQDVLKNLNISFLVNLTVNKMEDEVTEQVCDLIDVILTKYILRKLHSSIICLIC